MNLKYCLTTETITINGHVLHRIMALKNFAGVIKVGDLGGFIESERNLSHEGICWVADDAKVYGNATVRNNAVVYAGALVWEDAQVSGYAWVCGNAKVFGNALVAGHARVYDGAWVFGNSQVSGNARIGGTARVSGDSQVSGNAWIGGTTQVTINRGAHVYGDSIVVSEAEFGFAKPHASNVCDSSDLRGTYENLWTADEDDIIKIGDVVVLKSGGSKMTVYEVDKIDNKVKCVYTNVDDVIYVTVPKKCLVKTVF